MCHVCQGQGTIVVPTEDGTGAVVTCPQCRKSCDGAVVERRSLDRIITEIERYVAIQLSTNVIAVRFSA